MKSIPLLLLLLVCATAADLPQAGLLEQTLGVRTGFDTNPVGAGGTSATVLGDRDTLTYAVSASLGYGWAAATPAKPVLKLTYAGESVRFDRWSGENFSTHRLGLAGQFTAGAWKLNADGSILFVDGATATLTSLASVNANSTSLWRERRQQWQHRLKLQAQRESGTRVLRATGTLLAYDYLTNVVAGHVAFADRSDLQAGLDAGWKPNPRNLWLAGVRTGRQVQSIVPLPNCNFDYANNYQRLALGWEYKLPTGTSLSLAAGPDFRHYTGAIDPVLLLGGRHRTSLWFEGSLATKLSPAWTLSGKATRLAWLSSTGKSAYFDTCAEGVATWTPQKDWNVRFSAKVHRCDYYPVARDDWESLLGLGVTRKISPRLQLSLDLLRHQAWNTLAAPEREFHRLVVNIGAVIKL